MKQCVLQFSILACAAFFSSVAFAEEQLTITTYYPSPQGVYKQLKLHPNNTPNSCTSLNEGTMYYNNVTNTFDVCTDVSGTYEYRQASLWNLTNNNLTMANPAWQFTVGTTRPLANCPFTVDAGTLGTSGGDELNYQTLGSLMGTNANRLTTFARRKAGGGSSWATADFYLQRSVDVTDMGFIKWPGGGTVSPGDYGMELGYNTTSILRIDSNGGVGIGTMTPLAKLHVNGGVRAKIGDTTTTWDNSDVGYAFEGDGDTGMFMYSADDLVIKNDNVARIILPPNTSTQYPVIIPAHDAGGQHWSTRGWQSDWGGGLVTWDILCEGIDAVNIRYTNLLHVPSDARLKKDILPLDASALEKVMLLRPVTFKWIDEKISRDTKYGFIAQDVEKVIPELVTEDKDELRTKRLNQEGISIMLVKAFQQFKAQHDQEVESLRKENQALAARLDSIEKTVASQKQ